MIGGHKPLSPGQLSALARAGKPDAQYHLGRMLVAEGRHAEALKWLQAAARSGHAPSAYLLGLHLLSGTSGAPDHDAAWHWLVTAGKQLGEATTAAAMMAVRGQGRPASWDLAARLIRQGARAGQPGPQRQLGILLLLSGSRKLRAPARQLLLLAAEAGDVMAQLALVRLGLEDPRIGRGEKLRTWLETAGRSGHPAALELLAGPLPPDRPDSRDFEPAMEISERIWGFIIEATEKPPVPAPPPKRFGLRLRGHRADAARIDPLVCDYLLGLAMPGLGRAMETQVVPLGQPRLDLVGHWLLSVLARHVGQPVDHGDLPVVLGHGASHPTSPRPSVSVDAANRVTPSAGEVLVLLGLNHHVDGGEVLADGQPQPLQTGDVLLLDDPSAQQSWRIGGVSNGQRWVLAWTLGNLPGGHSLGDTAKV